MTTRFHEEPLLPFPPNYSSVPLSRLQRHATALDEWRNWRRRALAQSHLVTAAFHLLKHLQATTEDLNAIGIPVDILEQFPGWRSGSRAGFQPKKLHLKMPPAGAGQPVGWLRLQLSPAVGTVPIALTLLRDLLHRMDPGVRFTLVVEPGANLEGLRKLIGRFHSHGQRRVAFAELRSITVFAQDNARAALDQNGQPALLIPRAFRQGQARAEDELSCEAAQKALGMQVVRSQLYWEGGNILHDTDTCLFGVDTIAENMARLGLTRQEVLHSFEAELGAKVTPVGDISRARFDLAGENMAASGQASFHIDLDISLLGVFGGNRRPRALVADAARGLDFIPAVLAHSRLYSHQFVSRREARQLIEAEYDAFARERHPQLLSYAGMLENLGYRVTGVPDLRIDPKENVFGASNLDFGYCNVLPGLNRGRPAVHYLPWGMRALDLEAERRFQAAGVTAVRISGPHAANELMRLSGGLHCFCGPLQNGSG